MEAFGQSQHGEWGASWSVILHGCVIMPRHVTNGSVRSFTMTGCVTMVGQSLALVRHIFSSRHSHYKKRSVIVETHRCVMVYEKSDSHLTSDAPFPGVAGCVLQLISALAPQRGSGKTYTHIHLKKKTHNVAFYLCGNSTVLTYTLNPVT